MLQVHYNLQKLPAFKNAVITIGTFDGVHVGHQQIIAQLISEAARVNGETVILTFYPHPRKIVHDGKQEIKVLNSLKEKIDLLELKNIQHLVVLPFTASFANLTAEAYIDDFLVKLFKPHTIIIGYDHKFGKGRTGDYHLLEQKGLAHDYVVKEISEHVLNEVIVSSTRIREALLGSNISMANRYLGYPYFFSGKVVEGNKLGRTIGYPTANLLIEDDEKLIPGNGVYAAEVKLENDKRTYTGMMNIGIRPTVDGTLRMIEVNIFDFDQDIYGKQLRINIHAYLRGEVKFDGLEALKNQLANDKINAMQYFIT